MRVHSCFQSVNGEVCLMHQGSICTFIRLQGCTIGPCKWCDTPTSLDPNGGHEIFGDQLIKDIKNLPVNTPNITITGGEPLLQIEELTDLVENLIRRNYKISIETNGSLSWLPIAGLCSIVMDIKPPSSGIKDFDSYREAALINASYLDKGDWLKLPVQTQIDFDYAVSERRILLGMGKMKAKIAFSAVAPLTPKELLDWLFKENIGDVIVNVQIHKLVDLQ